MWAVYKHTSPNGKVYIGITSKKPNMRWRNGNGYLSNKHFSNAINKYGWDNITHEVLYEGLTKEEACQLEKSLIQEYKSYDCSYGYNGSLGGEGFLMTEEQRLARSGENHPLYGTHRSAETKAKLSKASKGKPSPLKGIKLSPERVRKNSESHKGLTHKCSDLGREHIRQGKLGEKNPNYGKPMNPNNKRAILEANSKNIYQIIGDTKVFYLNSVEAERMTNICSSNISRVCNGKRKTAGGYKWEFVE